MNGRIIEIVQTFVIIFILAALLYTLIPDLFLHRLGMGSWKRHYSGGVVLTFDDGPDPEYTLTILDILASNNSAGTFFLVGEKAAKYPEIVKKIQAEGHQIGAHCQQHRYAWFMGPLSTWKKWDEGVETIEQITGQEVTWIRPPWGTFNLALWCWMRSRRKRAVLWSVEGHDWRASSSPQQISERILKRTKDGTIIVLHDSGGEPGAPKQTLQALPIICKKLREEMKLPIVRLDFPKWSVLRVFLYTLWEKWEGLFSRHNKVERINSTNLLRLSRTLYKGPHLYSQEGRLVAEPGDLVAEIHLDNARLLGTETDSQKIAVRALRMIKYSLPELASYVVKHPDYKGIQVFLGLTLINRGVKGLGFEVKDVPVSLATQGIALLQRIILWVYQPPGRNKKAKRMGEQPKLVWMSREELLKRWLDETAI